MIVLITDEARTDLDRIAAYIAQDNPVRAVSFVQELLEGCRSLSASPMPFHSCRGMLQAAYAAVRMGVT